MRQGLYIELGDIVFHNFDNSIDASFSLPRGKVDRNAALMAPALTPQRRSYLIPNSPNRYCNAPAWKLPFAAPPERTSALIYISALFQFDSLERQSAYRVDEGIQ